MAEDAGGSFRPLHFALLLILQATIWSTGCTQAVGSSDGRCRGGNGQTYRCVAISSCSAYRELLQQRPIPPSTVNMLRRAQCGFQGNDPLVCCPTSTTPATNTNTGGSNQGTGTRPSTADLFGINGGNTGGGNTGGGGGNTGGTSTSTTPADVANHPNWRLLTTGQCGADVNDRIYGGEEANLKEYPWLALLQYQTRNGRQFLCGGALISQRYVLTAAHCVKGIGNTRLVAVRLGEHNTETNPDCMEYDDGQRCNEAPQDFSIAEVIAHPQYRSESRDKHHDIALLRLDRDAPVTDTIVPICLPNGAAISKRYEGDNMFVAGWGKTENSSASNVKLWVRIPVMTNTQCSPIYQRQLTLSPNQMCAGGQQGKDSCRGDSGGPLMGIDSVVPTRGSGQWVVTGVVSIGPNICATEGRPGIYTRVAPYVKWILDSMKS